MTLGSICCNSLSGQERWCEVHSVGKAGPGFSVMWWAVDKGV